MEMVFRSILFDEQHLVEGRMLSNLGDETDAYLYDSILPPEALLGRFPEIKARHINRESSAPKKEEIGDTRNCCRIARANAFHLIQVLRDTNHKNTKEKLIMRENSWRFEW